MNRRLQSFYMSLERRLAPGLRSAQAIYADVLDRYVDADTRWLDVGCGHQLFEPWIAKEETLVRRAKMVVGSDPDFSSVRQHRTIRERVVATKLPLKDGSFSLITANMVMEHIQEPNVFLGDVRRLLRKGGRLIVHTPNARHWQVWASRMLPTRLKHRLIKVAEGRDDHDVYPTYYHANTPSALRETAVASGLEVESILLTDTTAPGRIYLGPLVVVDLLIVRLSQREALAGMRSNMIAVFQAQS
jgi:SAM-dependent methyltransferase